MTHVLIVGGTGMLRHATLHLATQHNVVSVVARTRRRLATLAREVNTNNGHVHPWYWTTATRRTCKPS